MSSPGSPFAQPTSLQPSPTGPSPAKAHQQEQNPAIVELRNFLAGAPRLWTSPNDAPVRKFKMGNGEEISCVFWKGRFFITGTDVVKVLIFRFQLLGRNILNPKKFEEGVFSDLRNLKPGTDAVLEEPRSEFLEFLHKHGCIRTQKKQKVFFWHKVPHEDLFREALERNLKRATTAFNLSTLMASPDMMRNMMMQAAVASGQMAVMHNGMMIPQGQIFMPGQQQPYMNQFPSQQVQMGDPMNSMLYNNPTSPAEPRRQAHPRRTISLSHVDFTQPMASDTSSSMASSPMLPPGFDIASALSSPMFSPDVEINDSFFDLESTSSPIAADPIMGTVAPSDVMNDDPSAPSKDRLDLNKLETSAAPNELIMDPTLGGELTGNELLNDLWAGDKATVAAMNSPLWDDLTMVIPNSAPNRGLE